MPRFLLRIAAFLIAAWFVTPLPLPASMNDETHEACSDVDARTMNVENLVQCANGYSYVVRLAATRELFERGRAILPELATAGVRPMATINPRRADVIYTLIEGLEGGFYRSDSFGIHIDGTVNEQIVKDMGSRYGFYLAPHTIVRADTAPTCYVRLESGKELNEVLKEILMNEPSVRTVNLNYVER